MYLFVGGVNNDDIFVKNNLLLRGIDTGFLLL